MVLGGRRHRRHRRRLGRRGGSFWGKVKDFGKKAINFAREKKIGSKIARAFGQDGIANGLEAVGFGRRRRRHHRRGRGRLPFNGGSNSANQQALLGAYLKSKCARM